MTITQTNKITGPNAGGRRQLVAIYALLHTLSLTTVAARPVRLIISGPDGQRVSGSYVADGVTNSLIGP